jgi:hypothetical protein
VPDQITNLAGALKALGSAADHIPEPALVWTLEHWDAARAALTQTLARCAKDPEGASDSDMITSYFALHLMAQKRETSAFPMLRALVRSPEGAGAIFGGAGAMSLTRVMISLFDGDASMHDWLAGLPAAFEAADAETAAWEGWALAVASLGFDDLMPKVREVFSATPANEDGEEAEDESGIDDIEVIFQMSREEPDPLAVFQRDGVGPIDDAIIALQRNEEMMLAADELGEDEDGELGEPAVNAFRDVGRNDPCPCGSGKKFKKCHGA